MCGISGIHFFNHKKRALADWQVEGIVNELLLGIEKRGEDSTGVATIRGNGDIWIEKAELKASEFIKHRTSLDKKVKSILLHTRYATQGHQSNLLNNHPIDYGNAVIIHNGHINNDDELFTDENLDRKAEVDSEIIAALFDKHGIEKAHLTLQKLSGGFAIAAIDQRKPTALVLAKGMRSPLVYYKNDNFIVWASEAKAITSAFDIYMDSGPDWKDMENGKEGEIIYIEHGKLENLKFEVKRPVYTATKAYDFTKRSSSIVDSWDNWGLDKTDEEIRRDVVPRHGSYTIYSQSGEDPITYRCCFECGVAANEELFKKLDGAFFCDVCYKDQMEWLSQDHGDYVMKSEIKSEDQILSEYEEEEHMLICDKIGRGMGIPAEMVDYFLFGSEEMLDEKVENEDIVNIYNQLAELYEIEVGLLDGDEVEVEECQVKKMEIVKRGGIKGFLGL